MNIIEVKKKIFKNNFEKLYANKRENLEETDILFICLFDLFCPRKIDFFGTSNLPKLRHDET